MAKGRTTFYRPAARFIALRKRTAVCFIPLGSSRPENPSPRFKDRPAFSLPGDKAGRFRSEPPVWHESFVKGKHCFGQAISRPMRRAVRFVMPSWENRIRLRWRMERLNAG